MRGDCSSRRKITSFPRPARLKSLKVFWAIYPFTQMSVMIDQLKTNRLLLKQGADLKLGPGQFVSGLFFAIRCTVMAGKVCLDFPTIELSCLSVTCSAWGEVKFGSSRSSDLFQSRVQS